MTETIPVYIKGKDEVLQAEPAPGNQAIQPDKEPVTPPQALPKGDAKATAKTAKVTLVLDPLSITRVLSEGQKQTKLIITVAAIKFEAMVNSKSYRKALATLDELGTDSCAVILQANTDQEAGIHRQAKLRKQQHLSTVCHTLWHLHINENWPIDGELFAEVAKRHGNKKGLGASTIRAWFYDDMKPMLELLGGGMCVTHSLVKK
jgi:hypothetical protein